MKLYAISDLHLGFKQNRQQLQTLPNYGDDWLIIAGDVGEKETHLRFALEALGQRFARLLWVPGNHDLWSLPGDSHRGQAKYNHQVQICREYGVLTPEDPYAIWPGEGGPCLLAPLFTLYDYTFRPDNIPVEKAVAWSAETDVICSDEELLHFDPYSSRGAWCAARCAYSETRLEQAQNGMPYVLIDHFPLRYDLIRLPRIPRFSVWCGTRRTENWHQRFPTITVVSGHLHMPVTDYRDGVRFEEVSWGYPRQWARRSKPQPSLREILPGPSLPYPQNAGPFWRW
ncbi:metallophosphoesterase [Anaerolineales bacterium HSG6]|nr:metallophosphoesterase [Anaerolineales bacterium HSG6]